MKGAGEEGGRSIKIKIEIIAPSIRFFGELFNGLFIQIKKGYSHGEKAF